VTVTLTAHSRRVHGTSAPGSGWAVRAISAARHSGQRQRPAGSSRSRGSAGISRHQQSKGSACIAQSNALPQRGQRALPGGRETDGFMTGGRSRGHRQGNDATACVLPWVVHSA